MSNNRVSALKIALEARAEQVRELQAQLAAKDEALRLAREALTDMSKNKINSCYYTDSNGNFVSFMEVAKNLLAALAKAT